MKIFMRLENFCSSKNAFIFKSLIKPNKLSSSFFTSIWRALTISVSLHNFLFH